MCHARTYARTSECAQSSSSGLGVRGSTTINKCIIYWEEVESAAGEGEGTRDKQPAKTTERPSELGADGTRGHARLACLLSAHSRMLSSTWQTVLRRLSRLPLEHR